MSETSEDQVVQSLSESELREAADEARADVAADPRDEQAAIRLREAVQRYAHAFPAKEREQPEPAPDITQARQLIEEGELESAELLLRNHLASNRNDPPAMHMMGEIAAYCDLRQDAERILDHSAALHGNSPDALASLAVSLHKIAYRQDIPEFIFKAAQVLDRAIELDPEHEPAIAFKASMMMQTRGLDQARSTYERLLRLNPHTPVHWLNYGYLLKSLGEPGSAVAAFRTALALDPSNGNVWWALADLKSAPMFGSDIEQMEAALEQDDVSPPNRVAMHFALAKALDEAREYERSISHIQQGSEIHRRIQQEEPKALTGDVRFVRETFTPEFFAKREGWGNPSVGPIFIVGMHRAGTTLVEQILSSHSQIEGTEELFILNQFSSKLLRADPYRDPAEIVKSLSDEKFRELGARYLELASRSTRTRRPYFTDKNPTNWRYVGFIHCMLPNAKIIDVRRNPMDCCFANYARHYSNAVNHSFGQADMANHYRGYVATMRHFDAVLPGRVHRVIHDNLVDDLETEVRRLLDHIGVPFEEGCLRFFETERAVHTPSSEQVRQPVNRKGFGRWRHYEPWLGKMKETLGEMLEDWRS